jgi:hypothetical protein
MNWTYEEKPIEKYCFQEINDFLEWYKNNIKDSCCY